MTVQPSSDSEIKIAALKGASSTAVAVVTCAVFIMIGGTFLGAPWPAAVAVCALAVMGTVISCFQLINR